MALFAAISIDQNTLIPIGTVLSIGAGVWWLGRKLQSFDDKLESIDFRFEGIRDRMDARDKQIEALDRKLEKLTGGRNHG